MRARAIARLAVALGAAATAPGCSGKLDVGGTASIADRGAADAGGSLGAAPGPPACSLSLVATAPIERSQPGALRIDGPAIAAGPTGYFIAHEERRSVSTTLLVRHVSETGAWAQPEGDVARPFAALTSQDSCVERIEGFSMALASPDRALIARPSSTDCASTALELLVVATTGPMVFADAQRMDASWGKQTLTSRAVASDGTLARVSDGELVLDRVGAQRIARMTSSLESGSYESAMVVASGSELALLTEREVASRPIREVHRTRDLTTLKPRFGPPVRLENEGLSLAIHETRVAWLEAAPFGATVHVVEGDAPPTRAEVPGLPRLRLTRAAVALGPNRVFVAASHGTSGSTTDVERGGVALSSYNVPESQPTHEATVNLLLDPRTAGTMAPDGSPKVAVAVGTATVGVVWVKRDVSDVETGPVGGWAIFACSEP